MAGILEGVDLRTRLAGQNRLELLLFQLNGAQRFGINVFKVQEVIQCPTLTHVPHSHPVVRGIANLRGKTISIMDLSLAIGARPLEDYQNKFVIITEYNQKIQGFLVGAVDRIINRNWEEIKPPPKGTAKGSYLTAVTEIDGELVEIIDVEKVLAEVVGGQEDVSEGVIRDEVSTIEQHVLVADDSSVARKQVARVLERLGVGYTLCNDGREALEQLERWAEERSDLEQWLALVISDIEMPRMDGYSLTRSVKDNPKLKDLFIMLHTSLSGVFNKQMVERVGADAFLSKWDPDALTTLVQDRILEHGGQVSGG